MSRWILFILLLLTGLALAVRCPSLSVRPMHNDEGVNGYKFAQLWPHGSYKYDPNEHHGPTLVYATYALVGLTGAPEIAQVSDSRLRMVTVVFGAALLLLLLLTVDALGRRGTLWAALFIAVSPAMVFYSRYYIHEMLLVFFTFLALAAGWRYWRTRKIGWILLAGAALGLTQATKETFVFSLAAGAFAVGLNQVWNRWLDATGVSVRAMSLDWRHVAAGVVAWLLVAVVLFSSFFSNAAGPLDSIRTYLPWLHRVGGDSPHLHGWGYYWKHLLWFHAEGGQVWTELLVLVLAMVGGAAGFVRKNLGRGNPSFLRFLTLYTVVLAGIYTVIPYKTPWCVLTFWHTTLLLAGVGAAILVRLLHRTLLQAGVTLALLAGAAHLGWQARELSLPLAYAQTNPYVYSPTLPGMLELVNRVDKLGKASLQGNQTVIKVMAPDSDFWPLPWYLRAFPNCGWWAEIPPDPYAPIMIVSARFRAGLDDKKTHLMVGYYHTRADAFFELYVQKELWEQYLRLFPPSNTEE